MKNLLIFLAATLMVCCKSTKKEKQEIDPEIHSIVPKVEPIPKLDLKQANALAQLPLHCMNLEYPNRLDQTLGGIEDLQSPSTLHPAFYGCFDWHSAVHGYWSLVSLLKQFPDLDEVENIKKKLLKNISKENIEVEIKFFSNQLNKSFERTYGWAWLLKLVEELHVWNDPIARELEINLKPLTNLIIEKYIEFLPKLNYPQRVGTHTNTAFGLSFAYDYAKILKNEPLKNAIKERSKFFFLSDKNCPMSWEPSGSDFLSPCLEEAALMKRILTKNEFRIWLTSFLPQLKDKNFVLQVGLVSDRTDGQLVHLDGVNFSRAWSLCKIAEGLPEYKHLYNTAYRHINYSMPNILEDSYEGGHWLGSFSIYALKAIPK